jgi:replicative DNA helicase
MTALTVDEVLEAERILGVGYERTDINVWRSRCPICALFSDVPTLIISESREGGSVHISCKNGCENVEVALRAVLSKAGPWPTLGVRHLPAFPVDALPSDVAGWVRAISEESQTPTDLAAIGALGVLSAAAMGAAVVDCGSWTEELSLYLLVAMPSGDRKSTVLRAAVAPLRQFERQRRDEAAPEIRELRARRDVLDVRARKLTKIAGENADPEKRATASIELAEVAQERDAIGEPVLPRLLADDATPEALGGLLARHPAIAIIAAESALLDNLAGRYSEGTANLHLVCGAYGGETTTIDRRGRDPETIDRPLLSITLAVQPHVLEALTSHETARSQGLVARFACVIPETRLGRRDIDAPQAPCNVHEQWATTVRRVAEQAHHSCVGSVSASQGSRIVFGPEAAVLFRAMRVEHEPGLADGGDLRPIADWAARHPGRVARIAGLLHLATEEAAGPISEATMRDALRIGDYLLAHGLVVLTGPDDQMRRALKWLADRETVSIRDLQRGPMGGRGKSNEAMALADRLVQYGALREIPVEHKGPGRPPSPTYEVNPSLADKTDRNNKKGISIPAAFADKDDKIPAAAIGSLPSAIDCEVVA